MFSPVDSAHIPLGKQRLHGPGKSIFYSASSGIWQTVWLELVRHHTPTEWVIFVTNLTLAHRCSH